MTQNPTDSATENATVDGAGSRTLRIGTRGSTLARTQAGTVRDALVALGYDAELHIVHTLGDASQRAQTPVERIGVGVFTETLRTALAEGECDIAVHSFKDLPTAPDERFANVVPERADDRDVLVSAGGLSLAALPEGARVGTGAPRRVSQLRAFRGDLEVVPLRGNIETRMGRGRGGSEDSDGTDGAGALDAVVLARAGLERVGLLDRAAESIDPAVVMPAPAQGALCVEARRDDAFALDALETLDDPASHARALAERQVLATLEAGCTAPVAAWSELAGGGEEDGAAAPGTLTVRGGVFAMDGSRSLVEEAAGEVDLRPGADWRGTARELGREVGQRLAEAGAGPIVAG